MKGHYVWLLWGVMACSLPSKSVDPPPTDRADSLREFPSPALTPIPLAVVDTMVPPLISPYQQSLESQGLVDVQSLNPHIRVDLKYATTDNFLQEPVYEGITRCYLQPEVAAMLDSAQQHLTQEAPLLQLLVFDGVRPHSVQKKMWELVKGTDQERYVAAPVGGGSNHNYGAAVDLGLYHPDTGIVDMGTPFDYFGDLAQPRYEDKFLKEGALSPQHVANRRLLRRAMNKAGFVGILSEWWHFNAFPKEIVREKYTRVE